MPEERSRRRFPRFAVHVPFLFTAPASNPAAVGAGWTRSLSEGGATVELAERLRLQTPLRLRLQTDRGIIEADTEVVWNGGRAPAGGGVVHGLAFTQIAPDQYQTLCSMFRPLSMMRYTGVRLPLDLPMTCHPKNPAGPPIQGRTSNMNRGGLLLRLPLLLSPGTTLEVTLHAPRETITVDGAVVWVEPHEIWTPGESIGHGFRFTALDWSALLSLGLLLVETAQSS